MALFPCSVHGSRFRGPASHFYVFVSRDDSTTRSHVRLCMQDAAGMAELLDEQFAEVSSDETVPYPEIDSCLGCHMPIEDRHGVVIVTGYVKGADKKQWMAVLHSHCGLPSWLASVHERGLQAA